MKNEHLSMACEIVGGQAILAKLIGVSQPAICEWIHGYRPIPIKRCVEIEFATNGAVSRKDLRPFDWQFIWPELADKAAA